LTLFTFVLHLVYGWFDVEALSTTVAQTIEMQV